MPNYFWDGITVAIISVIVSWISYGAYPYYLSKSRKEQITTKELKYHCILYTVFIFILWILFDTLTEYIFRVFDFRSGAIIFGLVSYLNAKKRLRGKGLLVESSSKKKEEQKAIEPEPEQQAALPEHVEVEPEPTEKEPEKEPEIQRWYTCPKCGQLVKDGEECDCEAVKLALEEKRQKEAEKAQQRKQALKKALPFYAVCAVLLVAVCGLGFYSFNLNGQVGKLSAENKELSAKNEELTDENAKLKVEMSEYQDKSGKFNFRKIDIDDVREELSEIQLSTGYNWIGSTNGDKYHWITCKFAAYIPKSDRVYFKTEKEAEESGRKKCLVCKDIDSYTKGYFEARSNNKIVLEQGID